MAGRDASPRPQQAAATAERSPLWGSVPGLNAFGPAFAGRPPAGQVNAPTASRRAWPFLPLLFVLVLALLFGVWRMRSEPSESLTPPAPPTATMIVWCDGQQHNLANARQQAALRATIPDWPTRCFADYGWCVECQIAWTEANP